MQFIAELAACHDREAPQVVRFSNVLFDLITLQTDQFLVADSAPGALMLVRPRNVMPVWRCMCRVLHINRATIDESAKAQVLFH